MIQNSARDGVMETVSIRSSLMRNSLALVLGVSVTILIILALDARRSVRDLSEQLIDLTSARAEQTMCQYFASVEKMLAASRAWGDAGLLKYEGREDLARLNGLFRPLIEQHPQISSLMVSHDGGLEYLLFRDLRGGDRYKWYNRVVWADRGPDAGFVARWTKDLKLHSEGPLPKEARDYDPRRRGYYKASQLDRIRWTDPYYFFVTHDAGMTATLKWRDAASRRVWLVAFDLLLIDLSQFTASMRPSRDGKVFVLHSENSLLGLPADARWTQPDKLRQTLRQGSKTEVDRQAELPTADALGLPVVHRAIQEWRERRGTDVAHFDLAHEGETWWAGFHQVPVGNQMLWIGVAVPERDFLSRAVRRRNQVLVVLAVALLAAVAMTFVLARGYSRPLESLAEQSTRVRQLKFSDVEPVRSPLREVRQLADANSQMMTTLDSFSRYVPLDLVRQLLHRGEVAQIGGRDAELTVLFTDIVGFTAVSERMEPRELTAHMAVYFEAMLAELRAERATVDKFVGDAIVAFWGAPEADPDQARHAVRAVLRCQKRLRELNEEWAAGGLPALPTCFGLNTGPAVVGNVGAPRRLNYTVLGDTVNAASRLESLNRYYGTSVLATEAVVRAAGSDFVWRLIDRVVVKGKTEVLTLHEPLGETNAVDDDDLERARCYERAFVEYEAGRFQDAINTLQLPPGGGSDPAAEWLAERCGHFLDQSPGPEWDGVNRYHSK